MADVKFKFEWNYSQSVIIRNKGFGTNFNREIGNIFYRHMYKYVPWDADKPFNAKLPEPHLAQNVKIVPTNNSVAIEFLDSYANKQYNGPSTWNRDKRYHKLSTSYWDKMCWKQEGSVIMREVNKARKKYAK